MRAKRKFAGRQVRCLVDRICHYAINHYDAATELTDQFRRNPTADQFDRLFYFRSDTTIEEFRGALVRLEAGMFGVCASCNDSIGADRLNSYPCTRLCGDCDGRFSRTRNPVPLPDIRERKGSPDHSQAARGAC